MALPTTGISIRLVRKALGHYSTSNLGVIVSKAVSEGVDGRAFFIAETKTNNNERSDGVMIPGARPFWNVYSNNIPAEWINDEGQLNLQLKRFANDINGGYIYHIGDFAGYNHDAEVPIFQVNDSYTAIDRALTISFLLHFKEMRFPDYITHILAEITIGSLTNSLLLPLNTINNEADLVAGLSSEFSEITQSSGSIQLWCSNAQSVKICTMGLLLNADWGTINSTKNYTISLLTRYVQVSRGMGSPLIEGILFTGKKNGTTGIGNDSLNTPSIIGGGQWQVSADLEMGYSYSNLVFDVYLTGMINGDTPIDICVYSGFNCLIGNGFQNIYLADAALPVQATTGGSLGYMLKNISFS